MNSITLKYYEKLLFLGTGDSEDVLRIVTHDNMEIRRYGYRYDNVAYKWKMNNHIFYTDEQLEAYKKW